MQFLSVLRSLSAAEQLSKAGYGTIAWVNGGLDTAKKPDLPVKGADDLRYGGIGGISEALGWTDVQREKSAGFMGGSFGPIKVVSMSFKCPPAKLHMCERIIILPEVSCCKGVLEDISLAVPLWWAMSFCITIALA